MSRQHVQLIFFYDVEFVSIQEKSLVDPSLIELALIELIRNCFLM